MKNLSIKILIGLAVLSACKKESSTTGKVAPPALVKTGIASTDTNAAVAVAVCDYDVGDTALTHHGWTKTFDDEFTADLSNWEVVHGGMMQEQQVYQPANVTIVNGVLQIEARHEIVTGPKTVGNDTTATFNYSSGWLVCKTPYTANSTTPKVRLVARIKVASGYGLTSLFWSYGNGTWPTAGEIDNMEVRGDSPTMYANDYDYGSTADINLVSGAIEYNPVNEDLSACYHVYTMEWTQNSLNSYLYGKLVESKTKGNYISSLFGNPQYMTLSLPVGGEYYNKLVAANIQTGTMYVDYVKVFTSN